MEKSILRYLDKSRLDAIAKKWSRQFGSPISPQNVCDMFHDVDIIYGIAEEGSLPDHWVVELFWDLVEQIGLEKLNHSPKPDVIAINLREFREACWTNVLPEPSYSLLTSKLPTSTRYKWIGPHRNVKSKRTNKVVHCWVFENPN